MLRSCGIVKDGETCRHTKEARRLARVKIRERGKEDTAGEDIEVEEGKRKQYSFHLTLSHTLGDSTNMGLGLTGPSPTRGPGGGKRDREKGGPQIQAPHWFGFCLLL